MNDWVIVFLCMSVASGSQKSSQLPSAVQYSQLMGNSTLQPAGQSQLCYQYDATAQPALAASPVQSDPLMAAQPSQIITSQLIQQRSALQFFFFSEVHL